MGNRTGLLQVSTTEFNNISNVTPVPLSTTGQKAHKVLFSHQGNRDIYFGLSDVTTSKYMFLITSTEPLYDLDISRLFIAFEKEFSLDDLFAIASNNNGDFNMTIID